MIIFGRYFCLVPAAACAIGFAIAGCSSGSDGSGPGSNQPGSISGVYTINVGIANIHCSDGSLTRKGYGTTGEILQDGEFLLFKQNGQTIGRGHMEANGKFHLSATIEESGYTIAAVFDGKLIDSGLSGLSQAAWTTDQGLACHQTSEFTATPHGSTG
ncbi:MAG: hypothetical protein OEZ04_08585 [Nitrospinota bacterium]|nr:hypothetical protein [Nitrospinota bacterium]